MSVTCPARETGGGLVGWLRGPRRATPLAVGLITAASWWRALWTGDPSPDHQAIGLVSSVCTFSLISAALVLMWRIHIRHLRASPALGERALGSELDGRWEHGLLWLAAFLMLPVLSNDVFSMMAYSELWVHHGGNPFTFGSGALRTSVLYPWISPTWQEAHSAYGPLQVLLFSLPWLLFPERPVAAFGLAKALHLLMALGLISMLSRLGQRSTRAAGEAAWLLVLLSPLIWIEGAGQMHNDLFVALLVSGWAWCAARERICGAGVCLGLALAVKLSVWFLPLMHGVFLLSRDGRSPRQRVQDALAFGLSSLVPFALCYLPFWEGLPTLTIPLTELSRRAPVNSPLALLHRGLKLLGTQAQDLQGLFSLLGQGGVILILLIGLALSLRARSFSSLTSRCAEVLVLAYALLSPVFHAWYLLPALPLAAAERSDPLVRWLVRGSGAAVLLECSDLIPRTHGFGATSNTLITALTLGVWLWNWPLGIAAGLFKRRLPWKE